MVVHCAVAHARLQEQLAVVFSELPEYPGPLVTETVEHLATMYFIELKMRGLVCSYRDVHWVQHYAGVAVASGLLRRERFELVTLRYDGYGFTRPVFEPLPAEALAL